MVFCCSDWRRRWQVRWIPLSKFAIFTAAAKLGIFPRRGEKVLKEPLGYGNGLPPTRLRPFWAALASRRNRLAPIWEGAGLPPEVWNCPMTRENERKLKQVFS